MSSNYQEFKIGNIVYLRSYNSVVVKWDYEKRILTLGRRWNYSTTTRKHIRIFANLWKFDLPHKGKDIQEAIDAGRILYDEYMW